MDQGFSITLTGAEREAASVLVVGDELEGVVKQLVQLQILNVRRTTCHSTALRLLIDEEFSHVIYSTEETDLAVNYFTEKAALLRHRPVLIAASYEPEPNLVCEMLLVGARAFLAIPVSNEMLDLVVGRATKGQPIQPAILRSPKRNESLLRTLLDDIDALARDMRARIRYRLETPPAEPLIEKVRLSASTLHLFSAGGSEGLVTTLVEISETLVPRGNPRIAALRRKLLNQRRKLTHHRD